MPKVSIVVPVYNTEAYLKECLDSILAQTLDDIEVIVVDDGSTDGSSAIMAQCAAGDSRVRVITKANAGYGAGVNDGLNAATSDFVTILEPDDVFPLDAVQAMYECATTDNLDFLKADAQVFVGEGDNRTFTPAPTMASREAYDQVFCSAANPRLCDGRAGQPGLYRRSFLEDHGIRLHESPGAAFQDTGLWAQCVFCGQRVRYLDHVCYLIRRDNPASSESDRRKVYCICDEYAWIRDRARELPGVDVDVALTACAHFMHVGYEWNLTRISDSVCLEFLQRYAAEFSQMQGEGHLDLTTFTPAEATRVRAVMASPELVFAHEYEHREQIAQLEGRVAQLTDDNERLSRQVAELESRVSDVYSSKSYRLGHSLGAPLRVLRGKRGE